VSDGATGLRVEYAERRIKCGILFTCHVVGVELPEPAAGKEQSVGARRACVSGGGTGHPYVYVRVGVGVGGGGMWVRGGHAKRRGYGPTC